jgi:hypothetical protein|tara:strand:- start:319 stop:480 length:162 start_codon:yes stop_codon:yes gene_type:complete
MKITKRDVTFFLLGIFIIFIIESVMNWEGTKKSLNDGFNDGKSNFEKVESKTE